MKKLIRLSVALIIFSFIAGNALAQAKAKTEITSAKQNGETIRYTLTSSKPFLFGNNKYILHIGGKDFSRYEQTKKDSKGYLTFLIPAGDFNSLEDGNNVYLAYGHVSEEQDMETLSKQSARCWSLGKFSKDLLTK